MKRKLGIVFVVLGSLLILSALGLFLYNSWEQKQAGESVDRVMPQLVAAIQQRQEEVTKPTRPTLEEIPEEPDSEVIVTEPPEKQMPVVEIDGYGYIGFVGFPTVQVELPVMADWSDSQLELSPCRFAGSVYTNDMVIMGHNYRRHFRPLQNLRVGERVTFTDMDGVTIEYEVVVVDVLSPTDVEEMIAGEYDLTLFTCTFGGKSRVTIRCDQIEK